MGKIKLTLNSIKQWDKKVDSDPKYGKEQEIIKSVLSKHPENKDIIDIAIKISVIDLTNSTQLTNYKSKISLFDLAEIIAKIENFDLRLSQGDVSLVSELATKCKNFGGEGNGVNLLSFASKYCCYHNVFIYDRDDYSIFDSVVSEHLYEYATKQLPLAKTKPEQWRSDIQYESFNAYIGKLLDEYGITDSVKGRRRMFDHFLWFANR